MSKPSAKSKPPSEKSPIVGVGAVAEEGDHVEAPPPEVVEPDPELSPEEAEQARKDYLLTRFWISAKGFWGKGGDRLAARVFNRLVVLLVTHSGLPGAID